ncbi:uncharacterized protein EI90DRAFT_3154087 [Cantharellus anzutake]|uniref:uncharacterized protein n=1 Tax=Cantharellus anzutake TaxID=1750568 RepID=UPI001908F972|nr:uncharacterized protein EI90DRAFT_3154087 [Cantharellus anzutake]KAF8332760.1 hypothetical protein EI90DRAFT_3154087 [Cantharellus anzutake]
MPYLHTGHQLPSPDPNHLPSHDPDPVAPEVTLDYDILCLVIEQADFQCLETLSLLSKNVHRRVAPRLWHSFTIATRMPPSRLVARRNINQRISFISSDRRLPYLRDLRIQIWASLGSDDGKESEETLQKVFGLLKSTSKLQFLEIVAYNHQPRILKGLAEQPAITPDLSHFFLDLGPFYDMLQIDPFWNSHPKITYLKLFIYHPFNLPDGSLPNLDTIHILHPQHSCMVRGRPVTSVDIRELSDEQCTLFLGNLQASTKPITSLAARFSETSITAYSEVLGNLPSVRSLRITQEKMPDKGPDHVTAMIGLAALRDLESIEWAGLRGPDVKAQEHFFVACSKYCPSIRKVTFHWWGGHGRTFERKSADGEWEAIHYEQTT